MQITFSDPSHNIDDPGKPYLCLVWFIPCQKSLGQAATNATFGTKLQKRLRFVGLSPRSDVPPITMQF